MQRVLPCYTLHDSELRPTVRVPTDTSSSRGTILWAGTFWSSIDEKQNTSLLNHKRRTRLVGYRTKQNEWPECRAYITSEQQDTRHAPFRYTRKASRLCVSPCGAPTSISFRNSWNNADTRRVCNVDGQPTRGLACGACAQNLWCGITNTQSVTIIKLHTATVLSNHTRNKSKQKQILWPFSSLITFAQQCTTARTSFQYSPSGIAFPRYWALRVARINIAEQQDLSST